MADKKDNKSEVVSDYGEFFGDIRKMTISDVFDFDDSSDFFEVHAEKAAKAKK